MNPQTKLASEQVDMATHVDKQTNLSPEQVVRTYARYAPIYDRMFGAIYAQGVKEMAKAVSCRAPRTLLEIGVGTGLTLPHYPPTTDVTGIDLAESMLAIAHKRAATMLDRSIRLLQMNGEEMPFPDASFDCITLPYVLPVTPSPHRLISEVRRVCTRGGDIFILNHFSGAGVWRAFEPALRAFASRVGFRSDFSYREHIESHDWDILSCRSVNLFGLSRLVHVRNG